MYIIERGWGKQKTSSCQTHKKSYQAKTGPKRPTVHDLTLQQVTEEQISSCRQ